MSSFVLVISWPFDLTTSPSFSPAISSTTIAPMRILMIVLPSTTGMHYPSMLACLAHSRSGRRPAWHEEKKAEQGEVLGEMVGHNKS